MAKNYFKLHFIILILGFTAILGKLISVSPVLLIIYRTLIASFTLFLILKYKKSRLNYSKSEIFKFLFIGVLLGLHWLCFFGSARLSNVSISLVAVSTTSFFTSILEPLLYRKKIKPIDVIFGLGAIFGMVLIFKFEFKFYNGLIVGLIGAVIGAVFSLLNGTVSQKYDSRVINFYEMIGAGSLALCLIPFINYFGIANINIFSVSLTDLGWLAILAIGCTVYPYVEMLKLYRVFSVFTVNLSLNMEPIYGIIMAIFIFGQSEKMSNGFYLGGILVFVSVILQPILNKKALSINN